MNIFVIVTDSLRADHVSCYEQCLEYNGQKVSTPNMARLAADGTCFTHAYSESLPTMPTRTTWWTGRTGFPFRGWQPFEQSDLMLAEVLWDKGFSSALFTDTYHMHKPMYNCGRGFDTVGFIRGQEYDPWVVEDVAVDTELWHRLKGDESDDLWGPRFEQYLKNRTRLKDEEDWFAPRVTKDAIQWLDTTVKTKGKKDDLFLWVDYFTPHEPWDPPEPYWSMYKDPNYTGQDIIDPVATETAGYLEDDEVQRIKSLYAGEVTFVDKWAGILLDHIRDLGLYEDSLIIWLSDHGEPFGEHGIIRKCRPWNYEELVHIPWILKPPHSADLTLTPSMDALVQPTDLMPSILDFLQIETPLPRVFQGPKKAGSFPQDRPLEKEVIQMHGQSVIPLLKGESESIREFAFSGHSRQSWSIQDQEWRYLMFLNQPKTSELYYRPDDPGDHNNLITERHDVSEEMELKLRRHIDWLHAT